MADGKGKKSQTVFLKCIVISIEFSSPKYIKTNPNLGNVQYSDMLHNSIYFDL